MNRDYSNLHRGLVLRYFWQAAKPYKLQFFTVVICTIVASIIDIYIPLQYLKLWNVLTVNDFNVIASAKAIIIFILLLNFFRWGIRRLFGFSLAYFEAQGMAGLRKQAFSYMVGHSHVFFANNFSGGLTQKINKYTKAFEKLTDRMLTDGLPLVVRGLGMVIAFYVLMPKYALLLGVFGIIVIFSTFIYVRYKLKYDIIASEADSKTTSVISDSIGNHSSIQLFTGDEHEKKLLGKVVDDQKNKVVFNWYLWEGLGTIQSFFYSSGRIHNVLDYFTRLETRVNNFASNSFVTKLFFEIG